MYSDSIRLYTSQLATYLHISVSIVGQAISHDIYLVVSRASKPPDLELSLQWMVAPLRNVAGTEILLT